MCLILFSHSDHPKYALVLAANRDEFYDRPTRPSQFWEKTPGILAGQDLRNKGTWLGITRTGRIAALTNFRNPGAQKENTPSRGLLVTGFLTGQDAPLVDMQTVSAEGHRYNGFNLIAGDSKSLFYYSVFTNTL